MASKRPVFLLRPPRADPDTTVFVDGTEDGFRSLSHWPGNTTPTALRHDLSTGIALNWARLDADQRETVLGPVKTFANNHYDSDGVLSAFTVMEPEAALPHAPLMLAAAATGDFATWNGAAALAVDLTIMAVTSHPASPLADDLGPDAADLERWSLGYAWLIERLPSILTDPFEMESLWGRRHATIVKQVEAVEGRDGVSVEARPELDLAVVTTAMPLSNVALHHAAGPLYRVLLVQPGPDGPRYRFHYRDESWFDLVTIHPPARVPLEAIAEELNGREGARPSSLRSWWHTGIDVPVALMGFGRDGAKADGFSADPDLSVAPPSRLDPEEVVAVLAAHLA